MVRRSHNPSRFAGEGHSGSADSRWMAGVFQPMPDNVDGLVTVAGNRKTCPPSHSRPKVTRPAHGTIGPGGMLRPSKDGDLCALKSSAEQHRQITPAVKVLISASLATDGLAKCHHRSTVQRKAALSDLDLSKPIWASNGLIQPGARQ